MFPSDPKVGLLYGQRKITVTVDAATLEQAQGLGVQNLSAVVDEALQIHVERLARQTALRELLDTWDREAGPVPEADRATARAAFDELDSLSRGPGLDASRRPSHAIVRPAVSARRSW